MPQQQTGRRKLRMSGDQPGTVRGVVPILRTVGRAGNGLYAGITGHTLDVAEDLLADTVEKNLRGSIGCVGCRACQKSQYPNCPGCSH